jgi:hypothetical protein
LIDRSVDRSKTPRKPPNEMRATGRERSVCTSAQRTVPALSSSSPPPSFWNLLLEGMIGGGCRCRCRCRSWGLLLLLLLLLLPLVTRARGEGGAKKGGESDHRDGAPPPELRVMMKLTILLLLLPLPPPPTIATTKRTRRRGQRWRRCPVRRRHRARRYAEEAGAREPCGSSSFSAFSFSSSSSCVYSKA